MVRWDWPVLNLGSYWLCDAYGGWFEKWWWCDWTIGSGNDCTALRAGVGIGGTGVCIGIGVGIITLDFLLISALSCPILGLGMGGLITVGGPLVIGNVCQQVAFCLWLVLLLIFDVLV